MSLHVRATEELVALSTRIRYLQLLRLAFVGVVTIFALTVGEADRGGLLTLAGGYLAVVALAECYWRGSGHRGLAVFNVLLVADGVFLAWLAFDTGATVSPFRYLILVHAGSVALLASYRTGMKVTFWHSLLLLVAHHAHAAGVITPAMDTGSASGPGLPRLAAFVAALWFMALGTATFSAINERELRRRRYDLEALAHLTGDLDQVSDPRDVADTLLAHLRDAFDMPGGVVLAGPQDQPCVLAAQPVDPHADHRDHLDGSRAVRLACNKRRALLITGLDEREDPALAALLPGATELIICPLMAEGRAVGAVILESATRSRRIQRRVVAMVEHFCAQGALALHNAWLVERLQIAAATDGLTGLANRRTFESVVQQELSRATRDDSQVSLALVDIDHFKQVNDTHGHQTGDDVLREVAAILRRGCRDFDTAARYGGEEFALVLPRTDAAAARDVVERLRRAVEDAQTTIPVTVSVGVTTAPPNWPDPVAVITAADAALYESKKDGRNRVTAALVSPAGARPVDAGPDDHVEHSSHQIDSLLLSMASQLADEPVGAGTAPHHHSEATRRS